SCLAGEGLELRQRAGERVAGNAVPRARAEHLDLREDRVDLPVAIERLGSPWHREISPLGQHPGGTPERAPRALVPATRPPQNPPHPGGGILELEVEPPVERAIEELAGDVLRRHLEERIDAGLDRALAEQVGAERVDGPDPRLLELTERLDQALLDAVVAVG